MFTLNAKARSTSEKLDEIRNSGMVPAVFYGAGKASTPVSVNTVDFIKVWKEAGESAAITLVTEEGKINALIHDLQLDPVKNVPVHVDFLVIDMKKEITVSVPLTFIGESEAVKTGSGNLVKVLHEVEVTALPSDLPHEIEVDISKLATMDDQIHVSDLKVSKGATIATDGNEVVALVAAQKEEEEETPTADISTIEVEKKGKKEEEEVA